MCVGLSFGMSTPRIRGMALSSQPWRCLWRGLVQMTSSLPCRRTILQFSQIRLMLARTFMTVLPPETAVIREIVFITAAARTGKGDRARTGGPEGRLRKNLSAVHDRFNLPG